MPQDQAAKKAKKRQLEKIKKLADEYNENHPEYGIIGVGHYSDGKMIGIGNEAIYSPMLDNIEVVESHPAFIRIARRQPQAQLPEAPTMNRSFGYETARQFLNKKCFPVVLPKKRPGYGTDRLRNKPVWWNLPRWKSINGDKGRFKRNELVLLIASIYDHCDRPIDPSTIWLAPQQANSEDDDTPDSSALDLESMADQLSDLDEQQHPGCSTSADVSVDLQLALVGAPIAIPIDASEEASSSQQQPDSIVPMDTDEPLSDQRHASSDPSDTSEYTTLVSDVSASHGVPMLIADQVYPVDLTVPTVHENYGLPWSRGSCVTGMVQPEPANATVNHQLLPMEVPQVSPILPRRKPLAKVLKERFHKSRHEQPPP